MNDIQLNIRFYVKPFLIVFFLVFFKLSQELYKIYKKTINGFCVKKRIEIMYCFLFKNFYTLLSYDFMKRLREWCLELVSLIEGMTIFFVKFMNKNFKCIFLEAAFFNLVDTFKKILYLDTNMENGSFHRLLGIEKMVLCSKLYYNIVKLKKHMSKVTYAPVICWYWYSS